MQAQFRFKTLIELFNESLRNVERLDKDCLEVIAAGHEQLTFGQLKSSAQRFALCLIRDAHVGFGDKVAVLGRNRVDWDVAFWGSVLAGAVPVLIDPERGPEGVISHLSHTDAGLLVMADDYEGAESRKELRDFTSAGGLGLVEMTKVALCDSSETTSAEAGEKGDSSPEQTCKLLADIAGKVDPEGTAVILCTSGTTGDPREVELTHRNLIANIAGTIEKIKITAADVLGHLLPAHHSFGLTVGKLLPLWVGATNIYTNKYRQIPDLIRDKKISIFIGIPALFTVVAKKIEETLARYKESNRLIRMLDRYRPKQLGRILVVKQGWSALRFFLSGAAPMPKWVLDVFWRRGLKLYEGYGTTENSPVYGFNEQASGIGSVGTPIPTVDVRIVNEQNETVAPGVKGEIMLGGPCIMKGYYKNPTATEAIIETDGEGVRWLHTGDLGYLDANGNLFITGRKKYLIVLPGGKNVNPELVESALSEAKFVNEVLVVPGRKKDSTGETTETVKAIVQPAWDVIESHTNHSHTDLLDQPDVLKTLVWQSINDCQRNSKRLSSFEKISPAGLEIQIEEFQKTSTGKIKRQAYMPA